MEKVIGHLFGCYESGMVSRRQIIAALAALVATGTKVSAAGVSGARLTDLGATAVPGSLADFGAFIARETENYRKVIREAKITVR